MISGDKTVVSKVAGLPVSTWVRSCTHCSIGTPYPVRISSNLCRKVFSCSRPSYLEGFVPESVAVGIELPVLAVLPTAWPSPP